MDQVWLEYQEKIFTKALRDADQLARVPADEREPYKSRCAAAAVIKHAQEEAAKTLEAGDLSELTKRAFTSASAVLEARWGLLLLETDQVSQAEQAVERGMKVLAQNPYQHITLLQEVFNSLGILWSGRQDLQRSIDLLQQGEELYKAWLASLAPEQLSSLSLADSDQRSTDAPQTGQTRAAITPSPQVQQLAKDKYAHTLFYLAQVYGMLGDKDQAATYCAGTLGYQLELGIQDHVEWAENCEQLANYYMSSGEVAVAEHLLHCSEAALALADGGATSTIAGGRPEVVADVALAWAKLLSKRLLMSIKAQADPDKHPRPQLAALPESVRFPSLRTPDPSTLHWDGGLATTMDEAKGLFNAAVRKLREALDYHQLDGHVTMHCNLTLEISELYKTLADFETDGHKKCVLHKARAKRVEPLMRQLNQQAWPDAYRALLLDVAGAYREIADIKFEEKRPHEKIAAAAAEAHPYYEEYLDNFKQGGKLPDKITEGEEEELYINAVFYLARVTSRLDPPVHEGNYQQTENLRKAVDLYRYCSEYVKRNNVVSQQTLGQTCLEMAELIAENAEMMRVRAMREQRHAH